MNPYPAGTTPRDIDNLCITDDSYPNREECFLCKCMIQQCPDTRWWFVEDPSGWVPTHRSDFTDAFQTQEGWVCSTDCWNENCAVNEEEAPAPRLFLVGGAA